MSAPSLCQLAGRSAGWAARTGLALVVLAAGVPMLVGGDEMLRGQRCNNNPYNLDSVATWIDWTALEEQAAFHTFARRLLAFRHAHPGLRPASWHDDATIGWHGASGAPLPDSAFDDPAQHFLGMKVADPGGAIYVAYNGSTAAVAATLPPPAAGTSWWRVADTAAWMEPEDNIHAPGDEVRIAGGRYDVHARSLAIFVER